MPFLSHTIPILLTLPLASLLCSPSQSQIPPPLSAFLNSSNPCSLPPSPSLTLSCSNGSQITRLSITGGGRLHRPLSAASADALFTSLSTLPHLTSLSLVSLGLHGPFPPQIHRLSSLQLLNLSSNYFSGPIPPQLLAMGSLQNLILAGNSFNGALPDFKSLTAITELDLGGNRLAGEIPPPLFSHPSLEFLDLSGNTLSGQIPTDLCCGGRLRFVNISDNLLIGALPSCFRTDSLNRVVIAKANCLDDSKYQRPISYCNQGALAANLPSHEEKSGSRRKFGLLFGIVGGSLVV
uniref:Uncharacterized protein n=1 Tax=Ananas comosus var. bracteatus TaxID=296719 RepID=A0A6V7QJL2_ANACO|nr:unnamed protein product [Ananas comosus var. bracteatus]